MPTEEDQLVFDQSRTMGWTSTIQFHPRLAKMSGRELLEAARASLLAPRPSALVMGIHIVAAGDGQPEFVWSRAGIMRIWAAPFAAARPPRSSTIPWARRQQSLLPAGARSATLNLEVSDLRGLAVRSGTISAQGRVVRPTRAAAFGRNRDAAVITLLDDANLDEATTENILFGTRETPPKDGDIGTRDFRKLLDIGC